MGATMIDWIKANWLGIVGILVGVVGIAYAIFTTAHSSVSYQGKTIQLIDSSRIGGALSVNDRDGNKIRSNVYALDLLFWNSGDISLDSATDRVRKPIKITLTPSTANIVDAQVQKTNNYLDRDSLHISRVIPSVLEVTWKQFEPGDAFRMLIVYASDNAASFDVDGYIVRTKLVDWTNYEGLDAPTSKNIFGQLGFDYNHRLLTLIGHILIALSIALMASLILLRLVSLSSFQRVVTPCAFLVAATALIGSILVWIGVLHIFASKPPL
jgi:hypothetical protein